MSVCCYVCVCVSVCFYVYCCVRWFGSSIKLNKVVKARDLISYSLVVDMRESRINQAHITRNKSPEIIYLTINIFT